MKINRFLFAVLLPTYMTALFGQLDTIHWLPPMHARDEWGPQYLYLSTPEKEVFPVSIRNGNGTLIATAMVSNDQPYILNIGNAPNTPVLVSPDELHKPIQGKGMVIDGPKKFYAYYRVHAYTNNHAGDLTCKGRAALGKIFRIGHLLQAIDASNRRSNFFGVMATEDSTLVTLSDFNPQTRFRIGGTDAQVNGPVKLNLQKGESAVFSQYISNSTADQPPDGFMGALLESNKPVAVNCGSWIGAPVVFQAHDIGIDQIAPFERVGKEYILCKGNGSEVLEHPIVIAHVNNTQVWLNGNGTPIATLHAGEYLEVPTQSYSAYGNLYIRTSEPVFVYQMIGGTPNGDDAMRTAGLIFVPPISCGIPNTVDNIYQPNRIGGVRFEGGLMITAMRDSAVTVRIDGAVVPIGIAQSVTGNPDFVTYRNLNLFTQSSTPNTISVVAEGAVQVAMYGRNQPASFAAFYSGFSKITVPEIEVALVGDGVCPDTLVAEGLFDGVQWTLEDSVLQYGPDTFLIAYTPGRYVATGYLGVCRRTDFAAAEIDVDFASPEFPYASEPPSCFGFSDGQIAFGDPYGGFPPYQFSIDNGQHFSESNIFENISADTYNLRVRDSTGCYSRPLDLSIEQPDSFAVELVALSLPNPLKPGGRVELEAIPDRPVVATDWEPADSTGCGNCLEYVFRPMASTWVTVTVYDSEGCPATDRIFVTVEANVYAPNVFKPESIYGNDRFTLFSREPLPIHRLAIFDRWGEQVFENQDFFTNSPANGWDGTFRGKLALPGVYVFLAEVEILPGKVAKVQGDVTLVR